MVKLNRLPSYLLALFLLCPATPASATELLTTREYAAPVGTKIFTLQEQGTRLTVQQVLAGELRQSRKPVPSFGIGAAPVWLQLSIRNDSGTPQVRRVLVETSWIDKLDAYWVRDGHVVKTALAGDARTTGDSSLGRRFPSFDYTYPPGTTALLVRVESTDPMSLPVYFTTRTQAEQRALVQGYSYGLLYGAILSILLYNLMLYRELKDPRYLYFSLYLGAFIAVNLSYTGHGYQLIWPDSVRWQQFSNPVLMTLYSVSGLAFALRFLEVRKTFPTTYRSVIALCGTCMALQFLALLTGAQQWSLIMAFGLMLVFSGLMILLGVLAWRAGNPWSRYFLVASIAGALGSSSTACAVLGWIPFNTLSYRAIDIGTSLNIVLLAFALAGQYRVNENRKIQAEAMARKDYLTGMNNRRAFHEQAEPLWRLGRRHKHQQSVILCDLDHFKAINDQYGHASGDKVLVHIAQLLADGVRGSDVAGRWGGEEFIILLPETGLEGATRFAEKIRLAINNARWPGQMEELRVTASFGVAQNSGPESVLEDVISMADQQLYGAKRAGRNRVLAH